MKKCTKCNLTKPIEEFHCKSAASDGHTTICKECVKPGIKKWNLLNREKHLEKKRLWRKSNLKKASEYSKKYNKNNKEKIEAYRKSCRKKTALKTNEYAKAWRIKNPEKAKKASHKYYIKKTSTPQGRLSDSVSRKLRACLGTKKSGNKWSLLVGHSAEDLKEHLEKQFKEGMSWDNYGKWHIDHIIPISAFNFEKPEDEDFKRCWDLKNLQPLWAKENISKSNKLSKHFQPKLIFT